MAKKLRSAAEGFIANAKENTTKAESEIIENATQAVRETKNNNNSINKTEKIEQPKKDDVKLKKPIGQPRKYDEPTKHVSFALPLSVVENLKILAGLKKTNQTQLILSLIQSELDMNADKIEAYKELLE
jgi:hypothetical protein